MKITNPTQPHLTAWRVWRNTPHRPWRWSGKRLARLLPLTAVAVASLAAVATSFIDPYYVVRLAFVEDRLYVGAAAYGPEWQPSPAEHQQFVYSCDVGFNCQDQLEDIPDNIWSALDQPRQTLAVCVESEPWVCYRAGNEQVDVSTDGGQTWQSAWQVPPGRREFTRRIGGNRIDMGPYDLLIVPVSNQDYLLVVAMGNEGVLIRLADGSWERKPVGWETRPTPFAVEDITQAHSVAIFTEFLWWAQFWVAFLLSTYGLRWIENKAVLALLVVVGIAVLFTEIPSVGVYALIYLIDRLIYLALLSLAVILSWRWLLFDPGGYKRRPFWFWLSGIIIGVTAFAPMLLWELGIISYYNTALTASIVVAALAIFVSVYGAALGVGQSKQT